MALKLTAFKMLVSYKSIIALWWQTSNIRPITAWLREFVRICLGLFSIDLREEAYLEHWCLLCAIFGLVVWLLTGLIFLDQSGISGFGYCLYPWIFWPRGLKDPQSWL